MIAVSFVYHAICKSERELSLSLSLLRARNANKKYVWDEKLSFGVSPSNKKKKQQLEITREGVHSLGF